MALGPQNKLTWLLPGILCALFAVTVLALTVPEEQLGASEIETPAETIVIKTIAEKLTDKNYAERSDIKATEIAAKAQLGTFEKDGFTIEVQQVEKIEGGIQVYVRAWQNGNPIGFGADGTVEVERIRIFNPPVQVPDGTYEYYDPEFDRTYTRNTFKEDPAEALRIELAQTIELIAKDGSKIEPGKIGRTTSTFRSTTGSSYPVDGFVISETSATWSTVRNGTVGVSINDSDGQGNPYSRKTSGALFQIERTWYLFNTATIGSDTISAAVFSLYSEAHNVNDDDGNDFVNVYQGTPAATTKIQLEDYEQCGSTAGATAIDISSDITDFDFNDWTLNATGLTWIDTASTTKLCVREGHDVNDDPPASNGNWNYLIASSADNGGAGTTQDPKLVVTHAASAPAVSNKQSFWEDDV